MFSLFFVASLVLPSVLGGCCYPDMFSAVMYDPALPGPSYLYVDWTANKYIIVRDGGDVKYNLFDIATKTKYQRYADGSCDYETNADMYPQCLPKSFTSVGHNTLGGDLGVETFSQDGEDSNLFVTVTDDCLPVFAISIDEDDETHTTIFGNVTVSSTTFSELSEDVSDCKMEEED